MNRPAATAEAPVAAPPAARRLRAFGLTLDSDLPLPGAAPAADEAPADAEVRLGPVAPLPGTPALEGWWAVAPGAAVLETDAWRLRAEDGRRVTVDPAPGTPPERLGLAVGYAACMALLHQRGAAPLHASVVAGRGGAALLIGGPGAGKSTFAALLAARGLACGGDDLAALDFPAEGPPVAHRGLATAKLFADSRAALGPETRAVVGPGEGFGKEVVALADPPWARWPAPLRAVFALEWLHPADAAPELERLSPLAAVPLLREAINHPEFAAPLGLDRRYFALMVRLAAAVPVFALRRPRRFAAAAEACALVERRLAGEETDR